MILAQSGIMNRRGFFGAKPFLPADIPSLALWVSADYGLTISSITYLNSIELSGSGTASSDGIYERNSGGFISFINDATGGEIFWDAENTFWGVYDPDIDEVTYINYSQNIDDADWETLSGSSPAPTADYGYGTDSGVITAIEDRSPSANNLAYSNGFPKISGTKINGRDAFDFTQGARFSGNDIVTANTIYAVIRPSQTPTAYTCIVEVTGGGLYTAVFSSYWGGYWSTETDSNNTVNSDTNAIIGIIRGSGTDTTFRRDGAIVRSGNYGGVAYSRSGLTFGNDGSLTQPAMAIVAELIIYTDAITSSQASQVENYLNQKYAIY